MQIETRQGVGLLAACISVRNIENGTVDSIVCSSVFDAVEYGIKALCDRSDLTAVVVVGEDKSIADTEEILAKRSSGLAGALDQAGLFITLAAQDIVRDRLAIDVRFEDFGVIDSPEAGRAERVFAVLHPDLVEPALPHKKVAGNCPRLHKSFVGRQRERDELQDLVLQRALVTISGAPGVGKSMMAIQVARSCDDEYEDGVWWFSVEDRSSFDELLLAVASTRGLLVLHGPLTVERVAEGLARKRAIVIFDGCESMANEIGELCSAVLNLQRTLTLLLTCTKPIGIADEFVFRMDPMSLPGPTDTGDDALIASDALRLFCERATQSGVPLGLDDRNVDLMAQICESLDGLPAAIELVAASLRTSSLEMLVTELNWSNKSSVSGSKGLSGRLPSLEQVLRVKSATLSHDEREMLSRLGMFRGQWNLDTAAYVWGDRFTEVDMLRLHQALVDSSWLAYNPDQNTYRMLNTIRSFCSGKGRGLGHSAQPLSTEKVYPFAAVSLEGSAPNPGVSSKARPIDERYCVRMAEFAAAIHQELHGSATLESESLLSRHYADFINALEIAFEFNELWECSHELVKYLVQFWNRRTLLEDPARLCSEYLERGAQKVEAARALNMLGVIHWRNREFGLATNEFNRTLQIAKETKTRIAEAASLGNLGMTMRDLGDFEAATGFYEESVAICRELGRPDLLCTSLYNAADGRIKQARIMGRTSEQRTVLLADAQRSLAEAKAFATNLDPFILQALFYNIGALALVHEDLAEAESYFSKSIALCARHNLRHEAGEAVEGLAEISLLRSQGPTAAKLLGLVRGIRREWGDTQTDSQTQRFGALISRVYQQVDSERVAKLMVYGEKLDLQEILTPTIFNM